MLARYQLHCACVHITVINIYNLMQLVIAGLYVRDLGLV